MKQINQQHIVIVVGDLGSGVNMVKNVLLLSPQVDFPKISKSRVEYIKNLVYPAQLKNNLKKWTKFEYKLRNWKTRYQVDIADFYADINTVNVITASQHSYVVFITHWPDIAMQLKTKYPNIQLVSLYAATDEELHWQINTYIEKVGIENLQNFSFLNDIDKQKIKYIDQHGINEYYKFNVINMFDVMKGRLPSYNLLPAHQISIGELHTFKWLDQLHDFLNIELDLDQARSLVKTWQDFHQPIHWSKKTYETN
jgi:hypothetical protein